MGNFPCRASSDQLLTAHGHIDREIEEYQLWLSNVGKNPAIRFHLRNAPTELRADRAIVMAAVQHQGKMLRDALEDLRNDKEVVIVAVKNDGRALQYASESLTKDKDVVVAAIKNYPEAIKYAHEDVKRDPDLLIAAGMFNENYTDYDDSIQKEESKKRPTIALSTRFSLDQKSHSQATNFTYLFKQHEYIQDGNFKVYAPNAFDKQTCDPKWTNFNHPCRGTKDTCQFDESLKTGHPTDECCWRYSFRYQLEEAKKSNGFMLQLVERKVYNSILPPMLGNGQRIERDMAQQINLKIFRVYKAPYYWDMARIGEIISAIKNWYDEGCEDMSECIVRPGR